MRRRLLLVITVALGAALAVAAGWASTRLAAAHPAPPVAVASEPECRADAGWWHISYGELPPSALGLLRRAIRDAQERLCIPMRLPPAAYLVPPDYAPYSTSHIAGAYRDIPPEVWVREDHAGDLGVWTHEAAHHLIHEAAPTTPLWLNEALATYAAGGRADGSAAQVVDAALKAGGDTWASLRDERGYDVYTASLARLEAALWPATPRDFARALGQYHDWRVAYAVVTGRGADTMESLDVGGDLYVAP